MNNYLRRFLESNFRGESEHPDITAKVTDQSSFKITDSMMYAPKIKWFKPPRKYFPWAYRFKMEIMTFNTPNRNQRVYSIDTFNDCVEKFGGLEPPATIEDIDETTELLDTMFTYRIVDELNKDTGSEVEDKIVNNGDLHPLNPQWIDITREAKDSINFLNYKIKRCDNPKRRKKLRRERRKLYEAIPFIWRVLLNVKIS